MTPSMRQRFREWWQGWWHGRTVVARPGGGNWHAAETWEGGKRPRRRDHVVIDLPGIVTIDRKTKVNTLTAHGDVTLQLDARLTVKGKFTVDGGGTYPTAAVVRGG